MSAQLVISSPLPQPLPGCTEMAAMMDSCGLSTANCPQSSCTILPSGCLVGLHFQFCGSCRCGISQTLILLACTWRALLPARSLNCTKPLNVSGPSLVMVISKVHQVFSLQICPG